MPRLRRCGGDANVLDQAAPGALRAQSRQDAKLQAADHGAVTILRDHELDMRIVFERLERPKIANRQRLFDPFARAAERIVGQHRHDDADVVAAGAPECDRGTRGHDDSVRFQRAGASPSDRSVSPIQRRTAA